jgi:hypothetical protein
MISIVCLVIYLLGFSAGMLYPIVAGDIEAAKSYGDVFIFSFFWPAIVALIPLMLFCDWIHRFHPIISSAKFMNQFWSRRTKA